MYSNSDIEGNETEMGEELSKEISDLQSDRLTQSLGLTDLALQHW